MIKQSEDNKKVSEEGSIGQWDTRKLGELLDFKNGINFRANDTGEEILMVGVGDFKDNFIINENQLSPIKVTSINEDYLMQNGDFVFVRSNGNKELIGRVLYAKNITKKVTHSGFTIRARKRSNLVLSEYCATYCSSDLLKRQFMVKGGGSNINNLNQKLLSDIEIKIPTLPEQKKILKILNTWNDAIDLKQKLIVQKKEQKKGLMQKLLTGEVRLPGFHEEWRRRKIGELITESRVVAEEPDLDKRITVRLNLKGVQKREVSAVEKKGATTQYVRKAGQFIYGKQNLHKGAIGIIPKELDGFQSSSDIPAFDFNSGIDKHWFFYYFSRESFYTYLEVISTGTGSKRINPKDLFQVKINVPPFEEQQHISNILSCQDEEINLLEKELEELRQQKKGLMQLLLTGKVPVQV